MTSPAKRVPYPTAFEYNGHRVSYDDAQMVSLTGMWRAAGSPENQEPAKWAPTEQATGFIASVAKTLNVPKKHVWKSRRGKHLGGTWAHWQIGLAYAEYLSHEFHQSVNDAFREWAEEEDDPALKVGRAIDGYRRRGREDGWIGDRLEGIAQPTALHRAMAEHGCRIVGRDNPFAEATRAISLQVLGKSARTRDHLDRHQLARLRFAESEAEQLIKTEAAEGNRDCVEACRRAGQAVKAAPQALAEHGGRGETP